MPLRKFRATGYPTMTTLYALVEGATAKVKVVTVVEVLTMSHSTTALVLASRTWAMESDVPRLWVTAMAVVEPSPIVALNLAELNPPEPLPLSIELPDVAAA